MFQYQAPYLSFPEHFTQKAAACHFFLHETIAYKLRRISYGARVKGSWLFAVCWSGITRCGDWMRESQVKLQKHTSETSHVHYQLIVLETMSV